LLRHRKVIGIFWIVVAAVGIALVGPIAGRLSSSESLPGLPSYQAGLAILHTYGNGGDDTPIVAVVTLPGTEKADTPTGRAAVGATFAAHIRTTAAVRVMFAAIIRMFTTSIGMFAAVVWMSVRDSRAAAAISSMTPTKVATTLPVAPRSRVIVW
jgi:hypothetical protein